MTENNNISKIRPDLWFTRAEVLLLFSLMAIYFVPSLNDVVVTRLVAGQHVIDILGQIEWFDTINETILAFLVMPLYCLLNRAAGDRQQLKNRIWLVGELGFALYVAFSVIILIYASTIAGTMDAPAASVLYLRLETVGFIAGFAVSFLLVVFVIIGKSRYIACFVLAKCLMLALGDTLLIPGYGPNGVALTDIAVNTVLAAVGLLLLRHEGLVALRPAWERGVVREWWQIGRFSGGQIFVNNLIYILIVCRMVNAVAASGNYWIANSFIWGWLLIPVSALAELVRRDYERGISRLPTYLATVLIVFAVWLISVPAWDFVLSDVFRAEEPGTVLGIVTAVMPFYCAYAACTVLESIFLGIGRTSYLLMASLFVNLVYYGLVYGLFLAGVFTASLGFIVQMFGWGMVTELAIDLLLYWHLIRSTRPAEAI